MFFLFVGSVFRPPPCCALLQVQSPVVFDPPPADTQPSFELPQASLDLRFLSSSRFHRPGPNRDRIRAPALPPPPEHSGYACWRCRESGVRITFSADLFSSPQSPQ